MSKNIEICINNNGTYETLYPKTLGGLVSGSVSSANSASTLSSTLSVSKGGTGVTSYSSLANQLKSYLSSGSGINKKSVTAQLVSGTNSMNLTNLDLKNAMMISFELTVDSITGDYNGNIMGGESYDAIYFLRVRSETKTNIKLKYLVLIRGDDDKFANFIGGSGGSETYNKGFGSSYSVTLTDITSVSNCRLTMYSYTF